MKNLKSFLLIISLIFLVSILLSCNLQESNEQSSSEPITKANIGIVDWTNRLSDPPIYYYIDGILKNTGNKIANFVKVKIIAYDINDKLISLNDSYADPYNLAPNQEATFQVMVENDSRIEKFEIKVIWE